MSYYNPMSATVHHEPRILDGGSITKADFYEKIVSDGVGHHWKPSIRGIDISKFSSQQRLLSTLLIVITIRDSQQYVILYITSIVKLKELYEIQALARVKHQKHCQSDSYRVL